MESVCLVCLCVELGLRNGLRCAAQILPIEQNCDGLFGICQAGSNVNAQDMKGQSPLHIAAHKNDTKMIEILIDAEADQSLLDASGRTPFSVAFKEHKEAASDSLNSTAATSSRGMVFGHTRIGPNATTGVGEDARVLKGIADVRELAYHTLAKIHVFDFT